MGRFVRRLKRDDSGIAALEFAWIAPALLGLYMGSLELHLALSADRRVTDLASASADLVSQSADISDQMNGVFDAASSYLKPFGVNNLRITVTSICHDKDDNGRVDWSANYEKGGVQNYSHGQTVDLPLDSSGDPVLTEKGTSLVLAEVEYTYTSPFAVFVKNLKLKDRYYVKPRLRETPSVINLNDGGTKDGCMTADFME